MQKGAELTTGSANLQAAPLADSTVHRAFAWRERAGPQHDGSLVCTKLNPFLRRLHADPPGGALLVKLGLNPESTGPR